jgi:hypothetical protein
MQVSRRQAARALDAMRRTQRRASVRRRRARRPVAGASPRTVERVLCRIDDLPATRVEVVAEASARRGRGERIPADQIADAALRRAVCDRLS